MYSSKRDKIIIVAGEIPSQLVEGQTETVEKYVLRDEGCGRLTPTDSP